MTGDKVDKATMTYGNRDDMWVANKVRMLMRDDLDHEAVCVGGRDRIMYLSQEVERLTALCDEHRGERDAAQWSTDVLAEEVKTLKAELNSAAEVIINAAVASARQETLGRDLILENAELRHNLTRARSEGTEEAVKVVESVRFWNLASRKEVTDAIRAEACRLAEQANKE